MLAETVPSEARRGGRLRIHTDFRPSSPVEIETTDQSDPVPQQGLKEDYGGHLELWDKELTACKKRILPIFHRCVIFATDVGSPHGQPDPLTSPPDRGRQSLALYYFDNPAEAAEPVGTRYMNRPSEERLVKRLLPPILFGLAKRTTRR